MFKSRERERISDETSAKNGNKVILGIYKMRLQIRVDSKSELERTTTIVFNGTLVERICDFA